MPNYICVTCGNEYGVTEGAPANCVICLDDRQYVHPEGQSWKTNDELKMDHQNEINSLETGLTEILTTPQFAIGQRALLVQGPRGNVLWDCVSLIDDATIKAVEALGGISALAMSHPHMFGNMVEWSHAFGNPPIYLHADYKGWVQRPDAVIKFWDGEEHELDEGLTLHRCGGHFKGQTFLEWPEGAEGSGVLLSTDAMFVTADRRYVSFMYSYPNNIPLSAAAVDRIVDKALSLKFDRVYSHFKYRQIMSDGKNAVARSAERYKQAIGTGS